MIIDCLIQYLEADAAKLRRRVQELEMLSGDPLTSAHNSLQAPAQGVSSSSSSEEEEASPSSREQDEASSSSP